MNTRDLRLKQIVEDHDGVLYLVASKDTVSVVLMYRHHGTRTVDHGAGVEFTLRKDLEASDIVFVPVSVLITTLSFGDSFKPVEETGEFTYRYVGSKTNNTDGWAIVAWNETLCAVASFKVKTRVVPCG